MINPAGDGDSGSGGDDARLLGSLGYAQELRRGMSGFSNFAISLSIICILAGGVTSLQLGVSASAARRPGWAGRSASPSRWWWRWRWRRSPRRFPTAGGLYHWSAILGGRGWGWVTAWFNLARAGLRRRRRQRRRLQPVRQLPRRRCWASIRRGLTIVAPDRGVGAHHAVAGAGEPLRHPADHAAHRLQRLSDPARSRCC